MAATTTDQPPSCHAFSFVRAALIRSHGRSFRPPSVNRRQYAAIWALAVATFVVLISIMLAIDHLPQMWKDALVKALHIRRVYRNYGPP